MSDDKEDPVAQLLKLFAAALGPGLAAMTEYLRLIAQMPTLLRRVEAALKAGTSLKLSPEDVKVLALILKQLSERK